jgi:Uma2 family endonuclease
MSEAKLRSRWTWEAYLDWEAHQLIRYELVDGQVYAMGGETAEHDTIGNNLRAALHAQLRGKPCRSHGPALKVRAGSDGRYPDALIDCGPRVPGALHAQEPVAVFGVLSKSTGWMSAVLLEGAVASIEIPEFGLALPFSPLYEGIEFAADRVPSP